MMRCAFAAVLAVVCFSLPMTAGQPKDKKPLGTWTRSVNDMEVKFDIKADTLKCIISGNGITIDVDADYGMSKDGVIFGRIHKVEKKGACVGPNVGDLFTFKFAVKDGTLTISELGPASVADARELIEGDYKGSKKQ
jgi:hypothetical protein